MEEFFFQKKYMYSTVKHYFESNYKFILNPLSCTFAFNIIAIPIHINLYDVYSLQILTYCHCPEQSWSIPFDIIVKNRTY